MEVKDYMQKNQINEAIAMLEFLKKREKYNFNILFELGRAYLQVGNNKQAIDNFKECLKIRYDERVEFLLAKILKNTGQYRNALKILLKLKKKENFNLDIDIAIVEIFLNMKRYVWSKKYIDKYLDKSKYILYEGLIRDKNYKFYDCTERELLELEWLYWELLFDNNCHNQINIKIKLLEIYCLENKIFNRKQEFINLIIDNINNSSNFFKKIYNTMLNTIEISDKEIELLSKPISLSVRLTHKCNSICEFCDCHESKWEISEDTYKQILELMPFLHEVGWTGGEVFLYKNFYELFNCAKLNNVHQEIITNAMLLNEKWIDEILNSNTKLAISIRSANKANYERLTKGAVFEKLIYNLEYIKLHNYKKHKNFELAMYILVTKYNFIELEQLIDFAKFYNFNTVRFIQLYNIENKQDNICDTSSEYYEDLLKVIGKSLNKAKKYGIKIYNELPINIENNRKIISRNTRAEKKIYNVCFDKNNINLKQLLADIVYCSEKTNLFCRHPWNSLLISNNGEVIFHCFCLNEKSVGSSHNSLFEIWNSSTVQKFREKILNNKYNDICNSMCIKYGVHK